MTGLLCRSRAQRGNTMTGVMLGLLLGVLVAVGVALYINFGAKPFRSAEPAAPAAPQSAAQAVPDPVRLPGKPGDKPLEKPQLDFYKILPNGDGSAPAPNPAEPVTTERLFLQAGAFQDPALADNLKARLTLMGIDASVQRNELADKGVLHVVRVGPFTQPSEADAARAKLAAEGIETSVLRNKSRAAASSAAPKQ